MSSQVEVSPKVSEAIAAGAPVVALESTIISHGPDLYRGAGPVIRACLRAAPCPVVVIRSPDAADPSAQDRDDRVPAGAAR